MLTKALRVALIYFFFGSLWIIFSDHLIKIHYEDPEKQYLAQTVKGLFFVSISSGIIFLISLLEIRRERKYQVRLRNLEGQLHKIAEQSSDLFYTYMFEPKRGFTYVSPSCKKIIGYSQSEHYKDPDLGYKIIHPDDRHLLESTIAKVNSDNPITLRWLHKNGEIIFIEQSNIPLLDDHGKIVGISGYGRDVTQREQAKQELERLNQAYNILWQTNRLIVKQSSIREIYQEACQMPFSNGVLTLVWIGIVDREKNRITVECFAGEQASYLENITITLDDTPTGHGPSGLAARTGLPHWSEDIGSDDFMAPWRDKALAHGFRSSAAFPLKVDDAVIAIWTLYSPLPGYFSPKIRALYAQLAEDISFALQVRTNEAHNAKLRSELEIHMQRWQIAVEATGDGLWDWHLETDALFCSSSLLALLGYTQNEWSNTHTALKNLIHADDRIAANAALTEHLASKTVLYSAEYRILCKDGSYKWILDRGKIIEQTTDGKPKRMIGLIRDITAERKIASALHESQDRLQTLFMEAPLGIAVIDSDTAQILSANPQYCRITGRDEKELLSLTWKDFTHPDDIAGDQALMDELNSGKRDRFYMRKRYIKPDGAIVWIGMTIARLTHYHESRRVHICIVEDITERLLSEERLEKLAHFDTLTGLPNRLMAMSRLTHALEIAARHQRIVGVLFMDLDHFKNINDGLGHPAGDELLTEVARRLRMRIRAEDTIARLGGDEFLVLLENLETQEHAALVARDLLANLSAPFLLKSGHTVYTSGSIGISLYPEDGEDAQVLIRNADAAMYLAKVEGRNTFRFYDQALTIAAHKRLNLEAQLRHAIEKNELFLCYQPIVDLNSGDIVGAEALCRWRRSDGVLVPPQEFIPLAEETGLIVPIGDFVLRTALEDAKLWFATATSFRSIAVNFSVRQFFKPDWHARLEQILQQSGIAPHRVEIEITETEIMQRSEEGLRIIEKLHALGVMIAIDDFGTGYSSLSYLQKFDVNKIKIDRSFIDELGKNHTAAQLVRTIIQMAKTLDITVQAEGVETELQRQFLLDERCDLYQGYLKSAPITAGEFTQKFL